MKEYIIKNLEALKLNIKYSMVIGNFDGVHRGHQKLIEAAKNESKIVAVMTFEPHPMNFIKGNLNNYLLTPYEIKKEILNKMGVDIIFKVEFDNFIMHKDKNEFIKFLRAFDFDSIVCGYDFTFGYMGLGNSLDLKNNFRTIVVDKLDIFNLKVSSSNIRKYLSDGDILHANEMLGRAYMIKGIITHGNMLGRTIGFRTANVFYNDFLLPKNGVYYTKLKLEGKEYYGMSNIGYNPTFNSQKERRLEIHIFNFNEDIYDKILEVYFVCHVRDEKKFNSKEELIKELNKNKEDGLKYFNLCEE